MVRVFLAVAAFLGTLPAVVSAQTADDVVWVQIEARPTLDAAVERAETYAETLPDVAGFTLQGGWYAITLGPYTQSDAEAVFSSYRNRGLIPSDSYIAFSRNYSQQYWPPGQDVLGLGAIGGGLLPQVDTATASTEAPVAQQEETTPRIALDPGAEEETVQQARQSERLLTARERQELQTALRWAGVYNAAIDGAFGRGTRSAMAAWQGQNGLEPTGVLTTRQRAALLGQYNAILDGLGMRAVTDDTAGIEIKMPAALVAFSRYDAPFAHYEAIASDSPVKVLLISQQGAQETVKSLFEVMQTLAIVPLDGERRLNTTGFSLVGRNAQIVSEMHVERQGTEIKGFTLIWPAGDEARRTRVVQEMRDSLRRLNAVLPASAGQDLEQRPDLISGLEIRRPRMSRSGFFVGNSGAVVTTATAVQSCTRITLDEEYDATLTGIDAGRGIAILTPNASLAPPETARFSPVQARLASEIAVAGFSFEGTLGAPSMTFGTLADLRGLDGETEINRLALDALPGDEGGPVLDGSGNVLGMLLPQPQGSRKLPDEVRFALTSEAILDVLERSGLSAQSGDADQQLDPLAISDRGVGMTVLVSCWD